MQALPYPAIKGEEGAAIRAVESRIFADASFSPSEKICQFNSAKGSIATYFREGWNAGVVAVAFEAVTGWASRNGIAAERIILGEFGATRSAAGAGARARWLLDVRCAAERRKFRWSVWELSGAGGMAIVDGGNENKLDRVTLEALGLPAQPSAADCAA
jgi:hypothetical protein